MSGDKIILMHTNLHMQRNPMQLGDLSRPSKSRRCKCHSKSLTRYKSIPHPHVTERLTLWQIKTHISSPSCNQLLPGILIAANHQDHQGGLQPNALPHQPTGVKELISPLDGVRQFPPSIHLRGGWS